MNMHMKHSPQSKPVPAPIAPLMRRLRDAWAKYATNRPEYEKLHGEQHNTVYCKLKLGDWHPPQNAAQYISQLDATTTRRHRRVESTNEKAHEAYWEIADPIVQATPKNLTDLAALAVICASVRTELWDKPKDDLEWGDRLVRNLVEGVLGVANEPNFVADFPRPQVLCGNGWERFYKEQPTNAA